MELVQNCRARYFGIWPPLSAPVQVRIGILNLLTEAAVTDIVLRFADAIRELGGTVDADTVSNVLNHHYQAELAAE
jgi:hypothetical protein